VDAEWKTLQKKEREINIVLEDARKALNDLKFLPTERELLKDYALDDAAVPDTIAMEPHVADAVEEMRAIKETLVYVPVFKVDRNHLRGERKAFLAKMATIISRWLEKPVSTEQVRHWLSDYRRWCKDRHA